MHGSTGGTGRLCGVAERVIAVLGPTAAWKSELALRLAEDVGGEIINADSMQLYAGMDIGTAKLTVAERRGIPHHLLDVWDVRYPASVAEYQRLARAAIAEVTGRGRVPILAGGVRPVPPGRTGRAGLPGHRPGRAGPAGAGA